MSSTGDSADDKERHLKLAGVVKGVHAKLRRKYKESGGDFEQTWIEHCHNKSLLSEYADAMHHLATDHWSKKPETRIDWCRHICHQYFFEADGLKKVLEKEERANFYRGTAESNNMSVIDSGEKAEGSPHRSPLRSPQCSTDNLEQLAKDIDSCPTCSPKKTKPPLDLSKSGDATPSIVVDAAKTTDPRSEDTTVDDVDFRKPVSGLLPSLEENCLSRDISQATSLETGQVSLLPHQGSTQNSDISDSWENLEELDLQNDSTVEKATFTISDGEEEVGGGDVKALEAHREALYSKYKPVQYNTITLPFSGKIRLLDVGSCFNPFLEYEEFQSIGIDISPAVSSVYHCDFLSLETHEPLQVAPDTEESFLNTLRSPIETLPGDLFHVVVFSLLLEYFPSPFQRWICCQKAHSLLMMNGLLLIITPDSHSQHRNAPQMKSWKTAIESMGFKRWRYVKQEHLHCMAFRKVAHTPSLLVGDQVSADLLRIPQDLNDASSGGAGDYDYFFVLSPRTEDEDAFIRECYEELPDSVCDD